MPPFDSSAFTQWLPQVLCAAFLAILFLQSGVDKVVDWKGNLGWLTGHFSKSPLRGVVAPMLAVLTLMELASGAVSAAGVVSLVVSGATRLAWMGAALSASSLVCLFFGQRMAKEYGGAAALVPYFLLAIATLVLTRG
ncbi:DoxX family protein [Corallococcus sp. H22C18031201]|uniref:DoxX family protein n=1 Tax=Citreicoccus inhibens TaxID=2849499 RepID=UPI000E71427A|nr:DoxX family protein [Citreicoccus inhibens]MBU8894187.1 DoxX family protein [Citreicoccus inhibens]RJS23111.1 DoxX family protein [Corallococcus sp. H22C18031201]